MFLNKKDLLEEKIKTSRLEDYYPEYLSRKTLTIFTFYFVLYRFKSYRKFKTQDYEAAKEYMKDMFVKKKEEVEKSKSYRGNFILITK